MYLRPARNKIPFTDPRDVVGDLEDLAAMEVRSASCLYRLLLFNHPDDASRESTIAHTADSLDDLALPYADPESATLYAEQGSASVRDVEKIHHRASGEPLRRQDSR